MRVIRNTGMLLLGIYLVLAGLVALLNLSFAGLGALMGLLALASGIAILIGYALLIVNRVFHLNPRRPEFHWRSASWLPVYLVGLGVIVRLSTFGGSGTLPLWWDMLVVAVFSLIIYYWAREVAIPTERIEQMINEVVVAEETPATG